MYAKLKHHAEWNATVWSTNTAVSLTEQRTEVVQLEELAE